MTDALTKIPRVLSLGGGLDSFCVLVESIRRREPPDVVCFVDVGDGTMERDGVDPGEWPGTYRHVREVVQPLCEREGIELVWLDSERYPVRDARSLFEWMRARRQIPVAGPQRLCTRIAKVDRFERWMSERWPGQEVEVWIGFEAGEEKRAANDPNAGSDVAGRIEAARAACAHAKTPQAWERAKERLLHFERLAVRKNRFPLIEWSICRCRAEAIVRAAGYPVPRKSACVYCCYGTTGDFQALARELPEVFAKVVALEEDKPPTTRNGIKLSIRDFRTRKRADGTVVRTSKMLPVLVQGSYRPKAVPCGVCGAPVRATKAAGCEWLA
jgi:hypothetical protein